jgi:hypothetical protein
MLNRLDDKLVLIEHLRETYFAPNNMPIEVNALELSPLFECLKDHLGQVIWNKHVDWKRVLFELVAAYEELSGRMIEHLRSWQDVQPGEDFDAPFMRLMSIMQLLERPHEQELADWLDEDPTFFTIVWKSKRRRLIANNKWVVLSVKYPIENANKYDELSTKLLGSQLASRLLLNFENFENATYQFGRSLEEALLSSEYVSRKCKLCRWMFESKR